MTQIVFWDLRTEKKGQRTWDTGMVPTKDTPTLKSVFKKCLRISEQVSKVNITYMNEYFLKYL